MNENDIKFFLEGIHDYSNNELSRRCETYRKKYKIFEKDIESKISKNKYPYPLSSLDEFVEFKEDETNSFLVKKWFLVYLYIDLFKEWYDLAKENKFKEKLLYIMTDLRVFKPSLNDVFFQEFYPEFNIEVSKLNSFTKPEKQRDELFNSLSTLRKIKVSKVFLGEEVAKWELELMFNNNISIKQYSHLYTSKSSVLLLTGKEATNKKNFSNKKIKNISQTVNLKEESIKKMLTLEMLNFYFYGFAQYFDNNKNKEDVFQNLIELKDLAKIKSWVSFIKENDEKYKEAKLIDINVYDCSFNFGSIILTSNELKSLMFYKIIENVQENLSKNYLKNTHVVYFFQYLEKSLDYHKQVIDKVCLKYFGKCSPNIINFITYAIFNILSEPLLASRFFISDINMEIKRRTSNIHNNQRFSKLVRKYDYRVNLLDIDKENDFKVIFKRTIKKQIDDYKNSNKNKNVQYLYPMTGNCVQNIFTSIQYKDIVARFVNEMEIDKAILIMKNLVLPYQYYEKYDEMNKMKKDIVVRKVEKKPIVKF